MLKIEELQENECYFVNWGNAGDFLIKYDSSKKKNSTGIRFKDNEFDKNRWICLEKNKYYLLNSIRIATLEEKHWFKECEKANKFIPYEEAIKTFKKENESLIGRYFKALEDNIQNSKTKKGEYYKIEENSTSILIEFNNKINKCLLRISKSHFDKIEIMPEGWIPEQENKPQFEVGKWYKSKDSCYIGKLLEKSGINIYPNTFPCREYIYDNKYNITENSHFTLNFMSNVEVSLSEIQQYLPEGHIDKISFNNTTINKNNLKSFPTEGCCYEINNDLVKYLLNRPTQRNTNNEVSKNDAIGIGWNLNSCWWLKTKASVKQEYLLKDLIPFCSKTVKTIEEWSEGSYVIFLRNATNKPVTLNKPYKILQKTSNGSIKILDDRNFENATNPYLSQYTLKWFPTLQEAEIFSKSLTMKEEQWIPKVGEWVVATEPQKDYCNTELVIGQIYIFNSFDSYWLNNVQNVANNWAGTEKFCCNGFPLRKALPHEIPQENSNSIPDFSPEIWYNP